MSFWKAVSLGNIISEIFPVSGQFFLASWLVIVQFVGLGWVQAIPKQLEVQRLAKRMSFSKQYGKSVAYWTVGISTHHVGFISYSTKFGGCKQRWAYNLVPAASKRLCWEGGLVNALRGYIPRKGTHRLPDPFYCIVESNLEKKTEHSRHAKFIENYCISRRKEEHLQNSPLYL